MIYIIIYFREISEVYIYIYIFVNNFMVVSQIAMLYTF